MALRAWIVSDLHISVMERALGGHLKVPNADICICAGDISDNVSASIDYLRRNVSPKLPVVLVLGNHDYYSASIDFALDQARRQLEGTDIQLLENNKVEIAGCRIVGATLWTDFSVEVGDDEHVPAEERRTRASGLIPHQMLDFQCIFRSDERRPGENGMITVQELLKRHLESRRYIDQELSKPFDGRTIVVTHHSPLKESFDAQFHGSITNAAFASDLSSMITLRRPSMWVHGHIHRARDYVFANTRIICNPRGYAHEREINGFRPGLVVDL